MKLVPYTRKLANYASIMLDAFDYTHNYANIRNQHKHTVGHNSHIHHTACYKDVY